MFEVEPLKRATKEAADSLAALGSELHGDTRRMDIEELSRIVENDSIVLMVARDGDHIIGMGTLYMIPKVGKTNGLIEDVIISSEYRGHGIGERLVRALLDAAKQSGIASISLTSSPSRTAAHRMYEKIGFSKKETDVFKLSLS